MDNQMIPALTANDIEQNKKWWEGLSKAWKAAFLEAYFGNTTAEETLSEEAIQELLYSPSLRFAGPAAQHANLSFTLKDLMGITEMKALETLIVIHCEITSLKPLKKIVSKDKLKALFLMDNHLMSLEGIEGFKNLESLYFQNNQIADLRPLKKLSQLRTIYCSVNLIESLKGIGKYHDYLNNFRVLPNKHLPQKEIVRFERKHGIRCLNG